MFKNKSNLKGCFPNPNMDNGLGASGSCVKQNLVNGSVPVGGCSSSDGGPGYKNTTGFPNCCIENPSDECKNIITKAAENVAEKTNTVVTKVIENVDNVVKAAKNCVAKNPNYPSEIGGCVYNPNNPCPSKYEVTDSRFGIKMCCDMPNANNTDCFKNASFFGSSTASFDPVMIIGILLLIFVIFYFNSSKSSAFGRKR